MNKYLTLVINLLIIFSCSSTVKMSNHEKTNFDPVSINIPQKIKLGEKLKIEVVNNTSDTVFLINPMIKQIEKNNNGVWTLQKILHCPCGANCQSSIPRMELFKGQNLILDWNLYESWCVKNQGRELISKKQLVEPGFYRVKINYELKKFNTITLYKEFEIIK